MNIFIVAFQLGLFTFLNPIVFPYLISNIFLFEKMEEKTPGYKVNVLLFSALSILIITFLIPILITPERIKLLSTNKRLDYLMSIPYLLFIFWVLTIKLSKNKRIKSKYFKVTFKWVGLVSSSFILFIASFSGFGPLLSSLILDKNVTKIATLGFSLGVTTPFFIILFLISNKYEFLREKKWWKIIQVLICSYLILNLLIKIFR